MCDCTCMFIFRLVVPAVLTSLPARPDDVTVHSLPRAPQIVTRVVQPTLSLPAVGAPLLAVLIAQSNPLRITVEGLAPSTKTGFRRQFRDLSSRLSRRHQRRDRTAPLRHQFAEANLAPRARLHGSAVHRCALEYLRIRAQCRGDRGAGRLSRAQFQPAGLVERLAVRALKKHADYEVPVNLRADVSMRWPSRGAVRPHLVAVAALQQTLGLYHVLQRPVAVLRQRRAHSTTPHHQEEGKTAHLLATHTRAAA